MNKQISQRDFERLQEIKDEMKSLLEEARRIVRRGPKRVYDRAHSYWLGHISLALDHDNEYIGRSMCNFEDTLHEIDPGPHEDEEDLDAPVPGEFESVLDTDDDGLPCKFENQYKCECGHEWINWWSCACNDRCPKCNKEIEPFETIEHEEPKNA